MKRKSVRNFRITIPIGKISEIMGEHFDVPHIDQDIRWAIYESIVDAYQQGFDANDSGIRELYRRLNQDRDDNP